MCACWFGLWLFMFEMYRLPNSGLAAAKLWLTWLAAAELRFGSHQTRVWQLPNSGLAAAKLEFGRCRTRIWQLPRFNSEGVACYCVILATFQFMLCWLVLLCSVLSYSSVWFCVVLFPRKLQTSDAPSNLVHNAPEVNVGFIMRVGCDHQFAHPLSAWFVVPEEALHLKAFVYTYYLFVCLPVGRVRPRPTFWMNHCTGSFHVYSIRIHHILMDSIMDDWGRSSATSIMVVAILQTCQHPCKCLSNIFTSCQFPCNPLG